MICDRIARRLAETDVQRIAVIKPSALGDVVQSLPVLGVLAERFPDARVSWVIGDSLSELVEDHPHLDESLVYRRRGGWSAWRRLLHELRDGRFDLVFDLQGLLRTGLMTRATGASIRIGLESAREGSGWACHGLLEDTGPTVPAHRRYWRIAEFLGLGHLRPDATIAIPSSERAWSDVMMRQLGENVVALHAGSRWETKRWGVEQFAAVGAHAIREHGAAVVLVGSSQERILTARLKELIVGQRDDPGDLPRILRRRRAVVGGGLDQRRVPEQRPLHRAGLCRADLGGHADHHQVARASQDHSRASWRIT